jgi:hypothetical protein
MVMKGKSELLAKYGDRLRKAFDKHKNDETDVGNFGGLPEGIEGGVAQLVECKFDRVRAGKDNAGEWYFTARGVVKHPLTHNGHRVYGLQTSMIEPLYDTPTRSRKTVDEHLAHILNQMRLLGADTAGMSIEDLEQTARAIKENAPHFQFRTWKGGKQTEGKYKDREPRVQETWGAEVEWNDEDGANGEAVSGPAVEGAPVGPGGGRAPVPNGTTSTSASTTPKRPATTTADTTSTTSARAPRGKAGSRTAASTPPPPPVDVAENSKVSGGPEFGDLDSLAEAAGAGDEAAEDQLTDLAFKAGLTHEFVEGADSWQTVVRGILKASGPDEEGDGGSEEGDVDEGTDDADDDEEDGGTEDGERAVAAVPPEPRVKQAVRFRPPDRKAGGKPSRRAVECTITAVDRAKRQVDLKSLDDPTRVFKNVPWGSLED